MVSPATGASRSPVRQAPRPQDHGRGPLPAEALARVEPRSARRTLVQGLRDLQDLRQAGTPRHSSFADTLRRARSS